MLISMHLLALLCIFVVALDHISGLPMDQMTTRSTTSLIRRGFKKSYSDNFSKARVDHANKANNISPSYHAKSGNLLGAAGTAIKKAVMNRSVLQTGLEHGRAMRQTVGLGRS
ncbi:uncharacterized protein FA14DRAFT_180364 [Meira miltonrushii]|uniref:Uncharacterized protein n=1 Tax=Meira miltonrushii TaxID=1280837 RepID=A0A316V9K7_9BASI|nr:uncharacterized protein FA14DRAFT_180364 [Meira miltonrushii]PWN33728.1 hypothetical protein FA14DRAFT_180364 [Meira miltonrushii]